MFYRRARGMVFESFFARSPPHGVPFLGQEEPPEEEHDNMRPQLPLDMTPALAVHTGITGAS